MTRMLHEKSSLLSATLTFMFLSGVSVSSPKKSPSLKTFSLSGFSSQIRSMSPSLTMYSAGSSTIVCSS